MGEMRKELAANPDDVPYVPSTDQTSYRRTLRCVRMRSKFPESPEESDPRNGVFFSDDPIRGWLRSEEASSVFWTRIIIPFIRSNGKSQCEDAIEGADLPRRRMAREINVGAGLFDDVGISDDSRAVPAGNPYCVSDNVVREAHAYILASDPSARHVYAAKLTKMPRTLSNNGVTVRRDARDGRLTRAEILDNATQAYPYLIRKIEGHVRLGKQSWKYRFWPIDAPRRETILESLCRETAFAPVDVYG